MKKYKMKLNISNQRLTTLKDYPFPNGVTELDCSYNQISSLEGCPNGVTKLLKSIFLKRITNILYKE